MVTVNITVTAVNDAPTAVNDPPTGAYAAVEDTQLDVPVADRRPGERLGRG